MGDFRIGDRVMFKAPPEYRNYPRWQAAEGSTGTVTEYGGGGEVTVLLDFVNPEAGWHGRQLGSSMASCWVHCDAPAEFPSIQDVEVFLNG